ncbi:hypothetical protein DFQ26_001041 [Actinomortierella ambigua]|nr:hypothetical protein DFQ26_001041 [Actinomortierella ambigua]
MLVTLKYALLAAAVLAGTNAAPLGGMNRSYSPTYYADDAEIATRFFQDCLPDTMQITPLPHGATEYSCQKPRAVTTVLQHHFGTTLFAATTNGGDISNEGWYPVNDGSNAGESKVRVFGYRFAGHVRNDEGQFKAIVYPSKKSYDEVEVLPGECTSDGHFCFDLFEWLCWFDYANRSYQRFCPDLNVVQLSLNAY